MVSATPQVRQNNSPYSSYIRRLHHCNPRPPKNRVGITEKGLLAQRYFDIQKLDASERCPSEFPYT